MPYLEYISTHLISHLHAKQLSHLYNTTIHCHIRTLSIYIIHYVHYSKLVLWKISRIMLHGQFLGMSCLRCRNIYDALKACRFWGCLHCELHMTHNCSFKNSGNISKLASKWLYLSVKNLKNSNTYKTHTQVPIFIAEIRYSRIEGNVSLNLTNPVRKE